MVLIFAGFKTEKTEYTGLVTNANTYTETKYRKKSRRYKKTYYDVDLLVEDNEGAREITIQDKEIANNFWDYFGEEVKLERKTKSWYGFFERRYSKVIDYQNK